MTRTGILACNPRATPPTRRPTPTSAAPTTWPDEPYALIVSRAELHKDLGVCSDQSGGWTTVLMLRTAP